MEKCAIEECPLAVDCGVDGVVEVVMVESDTFESEGVGGAAGGVLGFEAGFNEDGGGKSGTGAESRL